MARIIVSAGHTQDNPGTIYNGIKETDLTRAFTKKLIPYLRSNGLITLAVPPNLELTQRLEWINGTGYNADFKDISIEIHINDGGQSGFEFWYQGSGNNQSQELAQTIMQEVTLETGLPSQGVKSEFVHEYGSLAFLSNTQTISVLLECLYIDNPNDLQKLQNENELDRITKAIAKGITKFLNIPFKDLEGKTIQKIPQAVEKRQIPQNHIEQDIQQEKPTQEVKKFPDFGNIKPVKTMTREERIEMIQKNYIKILGREPNQNDLNYFLNIGISEDKLIKRMVDSQEHLDMLNAAIAYFQMRNEFEKQQYEMTKLKAYYEDTQKKMFRYNQALQQKNTHINRMRMEIEMLSTRMSHQSSNTKKNQKRNYKGNLSDRIFHFFSRILG